MKEDAVQAPIIQNPNKTYGVLGVLGGALIITSYFLPSYLTVNQEATPPYSSSDYQMASSWNNIYPALFGTTGYDQQTGNYATSQPHIFTILVSAVPMIMAALLLILGVWAIFKRPGPARSAFYSAAALIVALSLVSALNYETSSYAFSANLYINSPLLSLGSAVFLLGAFITLVSAFIGILTAAPAFALATRAVEAQAAGAKPNGRVTGSTTSVLAGLPATQGVWQADPMHTQVEFSVQHLGMMRVHGNFAEVSVSGTITPAHPERTALTVTIQAASIRTDNEHRDNDLRASNFLEVATYPAIIFRSTTIEHVVGDRYTMAGDLTIRGVTRPVTLTVVVLGEFNDPNMGHRIGYTGEGVINRKDFGMTFNMLLDGKWMVGDEVQLLIQGEIIERKPDQAAGA